MYKQGLKSNDFTVKVREQGHSHESLISINQVSKVGIHNIPKRLPQVVLIYHWSQSELINIPRVI